MDASGSERSASDCQCQLDPCQYAGNVENTGGFGASCRGVAVRMIHIRQVRGAAPPEPSAQLGRSEAPENPSEQLSPVSKTGGSKPPSGQVSAYHIRVTRAIAFNAMLLCTIHGVSRLGFATLTFAGTAPTPRRAQAAFARFRRAFLVRHRPAWIGVLERGSRGRLHYHVLVALPFEASETGTWSDTVPPTLRNPGQRLRTEWRLWRHHASRAGFGAVHGPLPIRRSVAAVSEYLSAYVSKSLARRLHADKGVKLVLYGRGARRQTTRTTANSETGKEWRSKLEEWSRALWGDDATLDMWRETFGPRWGNLVPYLKYASSVDSGPPLRTLATHSRESNSPSRD